MPETMSVERQRLVAAYGAQVVLTPGAEGMKGAIARAEALLAEIPGSVMLQQFENPANPERHYRTTAEEIWRDTDGTADLFVAGVGHGGTVSGHGRRLKELNPRDGGRGRGTGRFAVLSGGAPGPHRIQGIGAGFVPRNYDAAVVDRVIPVGDDEAIGDGPGCSPQHEGAGSGISPARR